MLTVRFSNLVKSSGAPEEYLVLAEPSKDKALKAAIAANRILTVYQQHSGTKADHGQVGFQPGSARQYMLFPKSLRRFADKKVVGINYDLMDAKVLKKRAVKPQRPAAKSHPKPPTKVSAPPSSSKKIISFTPPEAKGDDETISDIKRQIRRAMNVLEEGKAVAAFNLLKRIVGE